MSSTIPSRSKVERDMKGKLVAYGVGKFFIAQGEGKLKLKAPDSLLCLVKQDRFKSTLVVYNGSKTILRIWATSKLHRDAGLKRNALSWYYNSGGRQLLCHFKFDEEKKPLTFLREMRKANWEWENQKPFTELKEEDQVGVALESDHEKESEDEEDEAEMYELGKRYAADVKDSARKQKEKNSHLEVGERNSFVVRGNCIGVFRNSRRNEGVTLIGTIGVQDMGGDPFPPNKAFLLDRESKMVLTDPGDTRKALLMDLEAEKVVEEWQGPKNFDIKDLIPSQKYQSMVSGSTMVAGVNKNTVFRLDPRLNSRNKLADHKVYKSDYQFGCLTANEKGHLAVGSEKGEIRLYNDPSKNAKVVLPGMGGRIKGIDTTADGKWVVATCDSHLLLYRNLHRDLKTTGFEKRFLKVLKPKPIILKLRAEDIQAHGMEDINFTIARFNLSDGDEEMIHTSTGNYLIIWHFGTIKRKGNKARYTYTIRILNQHVVADKSSIIQKRLWLAWSTTLLYKTWTSPRKKYGSTRPSTSTNRQAMAGVLDQSLCRLAQKKEHLGNKA